MSRRHRTYEKRSRVQEVEKKYVQFSKKVVFLCLLNLIAIEVFAMVLIWQTKDTSQISYLITSIAVECLGGIIWYMKNSEAEKTARIQAEVDMARMESEKSNKPDDIEIHEFDTESMG